MARWLEPAEAARLLAPAARVLAQALEKESKAYARQALALAASLATVGDRLSPKEAAELCAPVVWTLVQAAEARANGSARYALPSEVVRLIQALDPVLANYFSKKLALQLCSDRDVNTYMPSMPT